MFSSLLWLWLFLSLGAAHVRIRHDRHFTLAAPRHKCGEGGTCGLPVQCPARVAHGWGGDAHCELPSGGVGVCCTSGLNHSGAGPVRGRHVRPLLAGLHRLLEASSRAMENLLKHRLHSLSPPHGSPAAGHLMNEELPNTADDTHAALEGVIATHLFSEENDLTVDELLLAQDASSPFCPAAPRPEGGTCSEQRYRSLSGTCNNLSHEKWGAVGSPMLRLLPPAYEDGVWAPRMHSVTGANLPGARVVSSTLFVDDDAPSPVATQMLTQFGQFVAHDVAFSPSIKHANGSGVSCCKEDGSGPLEDFHFACLPITIPTDDPFFGAFGQTCMEFVRAALAPRRDCALGYAQQADQVSHFIDGSQIYGTNEETLATLRTFEGGKMKHTVDFGRVLLPQNKDSPSACRLSDPGTACFLTGDTRGNQVAGLAVLHTLFLRHHNNLCEQLGKMNPHWSDETIFQEARRIVVAQLQHIVYAEWLPVVLGEEAMLDFGLFVGEGGFKHTYDPDLDPSISSEFAAAAFRFGHSTVQDKLRLNKVGGSIDEVIALPEVMFNPSRMRIREFYDRYLNMLTLQPTQDVDTAVTDGISKYLFRGGFPFGMDLISLNIQRGRDHGLKPYNAYRELVGFNKALQFEDFGDVMPWSAISALAKVYSSPDDVDLYVGGLLEKHEPDSLLGPTFIGIIGEQFSRLQRADRFFYAVKGMDHSFSKEQLEEIERTTMARLVCDNSDFLEMHKIQSNVFLRPNLKGNSLVDCQSSRIPKVDLKPWKELK